MLIVMVVVTATPLPDGGEVEVVSVDGGDVPTVAPGLTPKLAPILAPELVPDGGSEPMVVPATLTVYSVNLPAEAALTIGAAGLSLIVDVLVKPSLEGDVSCRREVGGGRCNPADLSVFDRYAVGRHSSDWTLFSDVALYASIILPTIYLGLESLALPTTDPWGDWARDLVVVSEAMALTAVAQSFTKFIIRRPRPARYTEAPKTSFDNELSFPSGHTSMVAAATTALTTTIFLRHPHSQGRWAVLCAGIALTGLTALARVEGGHHFPSDVLTGALVGGFAGFIVPWLHKKEVPVVPTAMFDPSRGASSFGLAGSF